MRLLLIISFLYYSKSYIYALRPSLDLTYNIKKRGNEVSSFSRVSKHNFVTTCLYGFNLAAKNKNIATVNVTRFGAKGDGVTDNRGAIQKAINSGASSILIPKGVFVVSLDPALITLEGGRGIALNVRSDLTIYIEGKLLLKPGTVGASSAIIGNTSAVKNVHIVGRNGGSIDGNYKNVKGQIINACLWNSIDCSYINLTCINSSFLGLSFRGTTPGFGRNQMVSCRVRDISYIGIQVAKPSLGFLADHCQIDNCGDNGIDIEGNNPSGDPGFGKDVVLKYCIIRNVANGVFLESVGGVMLTNSIVDRATTNSVYINRINSGSFGNEIINNKFLNTPNGTGVNFNSYVGETTVANNYFENFRQSVYLNGGATKVNIGVNIHSRIKTYIVNISPMTNSAVKCTIDQQLLKESQRDGFPETTPPISNTANKSNRVYLTSIKPALSLKSHTKLSGTFIRTITITSTNANWRAYSVYYGKQTIQYFPSKAPSIGEYVKINGTTFYVAANVHPGEYVLQAHKGQDGDYTAITNGKYSVIIYKAAWMEQ